MKRHLHLQVVQSIRTSQPSVISNPRLIEPLYGPHMRPAAGLTVADSIKFKVKICSVVSTATCLGETWGAANVRGFDAMQSAASTCVA